MLNARRFDNNDGVVVEATDKPHVYFTSGVDVILDRYWKFKPSVMLRYVSGAPISFDITAAASYNDRFEFGLGYRTDSALAGFALFSISDWFDAGYAYDSSLRSTLNSFGSGTHELLLKLKILN